MKIVSLAALLLINVALFIGCSSSNSLFLPVNGYTHPRLVEAEFVITIDSVVFLEPDSLKATNLRRGISADQPPTFLLWCSDIIGRPAQRVKESEFSSTPPTEITTENENGNRICFWDLSKRLTDKESIIVKRKFSYTTYDYVKHFDESAVPQTYGGVPDDVFYFYTKAEPSLEQTPPLILLADSIVRGERALPGKTHRIFDFVRKRMHYKYPPDARGVLEAIKCYEGDCGQYSALFIGLCRSAGIPARQQSGLVIDDGKFGYHVWSEVYLPAVGWVPMDATLPDGFAHLPNNRLIASVGMNLPLKHVPSWATYADQDAQGNRTDFMQFVTMVKSGFSANIRTERRLVRYEELP
ncbi:MAG: transglutaminase-like domain-containing protein [Ignavibacteriales bacterium]|nr:transglutaminase-like domain-containing protein [Ignavibacteriales bacterium]